MKNFNELGLPAALVETLARMQYKNPTPIQEQTIPLALEGKDILGSAQTGTGKTAAFGIPLVTALLNSPRGSAIVLTPTRELATQVMKVLKDLLGNNRSIQTALLIGGESMPVQLKQLKARPRLVVGTPGRINDHLRRGSLMLHDTSYVVLDETDRMLDMGFSLQLKDIFKFLPEKRQTLMFSATLPENIIKLSAQYLHNPERVAVGETHKPTLNVKQDIVHTSEENKYVALLQEIENRVGSIIIFVKTKRGAERLAGKLNKKNLGAEAIHGDLRQRQRDRVIAAFRNMKHRILVATDVAARGLDIPHIEHVINYDLPQCPEDYIHRIGRTGRAGAEGSAVCLISPEDGRKWKAIHKLMNTGESTSSAELGDKSRSRKRKPFDPSQKRKGPKGPEKDRKKFFRFKKDGKKNPRQESSRNGGARRTKKVAS